MSVIAPLRSADIEPGVQASAAVRATGVTRQYGEGDAAVHALGGVSLEVPQGQFTAVMGPSGSGKSTLMHILAGLDRPTHGHVEVEDQEITTMSDRELTLLRRRHVGFVFQFFNLLPVLTAEENVVLPLSIAGRKPDRDWVDTLLDKVGLSDRRHHRPAELSGGQQQRVAIARALVTRPTVLFADEPTGNLDSHTGEEILDLLRESVDEYGQTTVMVTHDSRAATAGRPGAVPCRRRCRERLRATQRVRGPLGDEGGHWAMIRTALKGMLARKLRTVLTSLAIVLGVGMVSAGIHPHRHLAGSGRHALDRRLRQGRRRRDDARGVRGGRRLGGRQPAAVAGVRARRRPGAAAGRSRRRGRVRSGAACGCRRQGHRRRRDAPSFAEGVDSRTPGATSLSPFKLRSGRFPHAAGEVTIDAATAKDEQLGVGQTIGVSSHGSTQRFTVVGTATFGSVESLGGATAAIFDLRQAQALSGKRGKLDSILVRARDGVAPAELRQRDR